MTSATLLNNPKLVRFVDGEIASHQKALLRLSKIRYVGDESDRDCVTHEQAFNRGCLKAFQLVRERLDVTYPVLIQFTGGKNRK